jgi:YidC/Oxa1 family membrane protein insertase
MFETFLVQPIYNVFVYLVGHMPGGDAGLAIVAITVLMRIVLYPIFTASIRTQMGMQAMQPELDAASKKYENDKEALARERITLLRKYKVNPFAAILALALQLVVIIALYFALFREGFPEINHDLLYSFVQAPGAVSTGFFGLLDLLTPNHLILALMVGLSQYLAIRLTIKRTPITGEQTSDKAQVQRMQQQLMVYFMPGLIAIFSYFFAGAVGLYFLASNMLSVAQEWLIRRHVL